MTASRTWLWPALIAVQIVLVGVFLLSPGLAVAIALGVAVAVLVLEKPVLGVGLIVAARVIGSEALTFVRIGPLGLGLYEALAILCLPALAHAAVSKGRSMWVAWSWKWPFLALVGWGVLSLAWSTNPAEGVDSLVPVLPVLFNTTLVLVFVRSLDDVRTVLWCWLGAAVLVCLATLLVNLTGTDVGAVAFEAASRGGRETGLGQQPNWFAMTLYFIVPSGFALAFVERGPRRLVALAASALVGIVMVSSGSRGGATACLLALLVASAGSARVRYWLLRALGAGVAAFGLAFVLDPGGISRAIGRIVEGTGVMANFRPWNWQACIEMFVDTRGVGVGLGGYAELLRAYNPFLAQTLYNYPHGVFWQVLAHLGVVGLLLLGWGAWRVFRMQAEASRLAGDRPFRVLVWVMSGTLVGYVAWTFFEFALMEKPFYEFLALATALHAVLRRS
jgi:hypothetical protein